MVRLLVMRDVSGPAHEFLEGLSPALPEGWALGLSVIGEDDEGVGPGRVFGRHLDASELSIHTPQDPQGVVALGSGVMRHLVVGQQVRVDDRPSGIDVADHRLDLQIALHHAGPGAHQRIDEPAVDPGHEVTAPILSRIPELGRDLQDREQDSADQVVGVGEVRVVGFAYLAGTIPLKNRAHGQGALRGVTGQHVGSAGAVEGQQPAPVGMAALDLHGIAGVIADHRGGPLFLPPAEGGHVGIGAVQQPRLGGARLGRPVRLPLQETVGPGPNPARDGDGIAIADGMHEYLVGDPVELEEDDAGDLGVDRPLGARQPSDDTAVVEIVIVNGEHRSGGGVDQGQPDGERDPGPDAVHGETRHHDRGDGHGGPVEEQRAEANGEDRDGQRDPNQEWPDQRVEEPDGRGTGDGGPPAGDVDAGNEGGAGMERDRADGPDDQNPERGTPTGKDGHGAGGGGWGAVPILIGGVPECCASLPGTLSSATGWPGC